MLYRVAETFVSVQGEGVHTGVPATFIRLAGCNLVCPFCDTDHAQRTGMTENVLAAWCAGQTPELVVITGGEPLLQDIDPLVWELHWRKMLVEVETNGTQPLPAGRVDFVSLSPKQSRGQTALTRCTSLKLLYPWLPGCTPEEWEDFPAEARFVQPIDGVEDATRGAVADVILRRGWRLGVQAHKGWRVR